MKIHAKKIYKSAVKELKKHQVEIEIALAALTLAAAAFAKDENADEHAQVVDAYELMLEDTIKQIARLNGLIENM